MKYNELHLHTHFSALDGVSTSEEYAKRANEIGIEALAVTDHGTLISHHDHLVACRSAGIKPMLGVEGYFSASDRFDRRKRDEREDNVLVYNHLGIIAKNQTGLENLQKMQRIASTEGYFFKPRVDFDLLEEHSEGIIVLSGCMSGIVSQHLELGDYDKAKEWASKFQSLYGDDYYMEVMAHNPEEMTAGHFQIADELGIKVITTSDCHHATTDDAVLQEAMLILQSGPKEAKNWEWSKAQKMDMLERFNYVYPDRSMNFEKYDLHLHEATEHLRKFAALGYDRTDFIENTVDLSDKIEGYVEYSGLDLLPKPKVDNVDDTLEELVVYGAKKRGTLGDPEYDARRKMELDLIKAKKFSTYFLIEKTIVDWSKEQNIRLGEGRGSAAGSLINYELGITGLDPIEHGLIFERFLDPTRPDMPDIDTDIQDDRRGEVKAFAKTLAHTGNIMTFTYLEGKNIFKDACSILRVPYAEANELAKEILNWDDYLESPKTTAFRKKYPEVQEIGELIRGRLRSVGMHAAGVVMSSEPLERYAAVESAKDPDNEGSRVEVLAMDQHRAEDLGLIKFDFLGLAALTKIQRTLETIEQRHGIALDIEALPLDDPEVFKSFTRDGVAGIFQAEGSAFTKILLDMPIESFDDIVAATSLIRPGAADSSFGKKYLKARNGAAWKPYCEVMRPFTEETYGQILMQEQLMHTCTEVAGMSMADANKVRRIIGKKKDVSEFGPFRDAFVNGSVERGNLTEKQAKAMWTDFEKAANYMFNKSHAVAYSVLTYQTAWLKHYYPAEYMLSLLESETDATTRILYLNEVRRLGIELRFPHVEESDMNMSIRDGANGPYLLMGLKDTKYIGPAGAQKIIDKRPFGSYENLKSAAEQKYSGIPVRGLQYLNRVNGCSYPDNPARDDISADQFDVLGVPNFNTDVLPDSVIENATPVIELSSKSATYTVAMVLDIVRKNGWQRADLFDETGTEGCFFGNEVHVEKGTFYVFLIADGSIIEAIPVDEIPESSPFAAYLFTEKLRPFDGHRIVDFKTRQTKNGVTMGTVVVTDDQKNLTALTVFARAVDRVKYLHGLGRVVEIKAKENTFRGKTSLVLEDIK